MEKIIKKAHDSITRIKGKDYAPTSNEIQEWIDNQNIFYSKNDVLRMLRSFHTLEMNVQLCMLKLTPIELPSDEEIKKLELEYAINFGTNMGIGFKIGCQWIKEQILNQNK